MAKRVVPLRASNLDDIPGSCRTCAHWTMKTGDNVERLLREWGSCGYILYDDKKPAGFVMYGPAKYFPKSGLYPAAPISKDAVFISCLYVEPDKRGAGLGKRLITAAVKDVFERDFKALEALAGRDEERVPAVPLEFYLERGFYIYRNDKRHPLVRMDVKSLAGWQRKAGEAIENLTLKSRAKTPVKAPA